MFRVGDIVKFSKSYNIETDYNDADSLLEILAVYPNLDCNWRARYRINYLDKIDRKRSFDWVEDHVNLDLVKNKSEL